MATCLRTHRQTHTIKPPTAGVQLVGHTSKIHVLPYIDTCVTCPPCKTSTSAISAHTNVTSTIFGYWFVILQTALSCGANIGVVPSLWAYFRCIQF